jgi:cysteine desulfurase
MNSTSDPIYLDHNATTPILSEVVDAMLPYLCEHFGNPSSAHVFGQRAREAVEQARGQVAALLGCAADEVLFTSGGTEANNLAIRGVAEARPGMRHIVTSGIEHPATSAPCQWLERHGYRIARVGVDAMGRVRPDDVVATVDNDTALVTVMHANNETGVLQPITEIAHIAKARGAVVHTDAAQSVGKVRVDVGALAVDLLSLAGHKLYGPKGIGALYIRRGTPLAPFMLGAGHERRLRPGTENVAGIVGLGTACEIAGRDLDELERRLRTLCDRLWTLLRQRVPGLALNGHPDQRLPNTLNVRFPFVHGNALLVSAPEIAASTGSACHGAAEVASAVILAMRVPEGDAIGSVRLTLGRSTSAADVERAAEVLGRAWAGLRRA